MKRWFSTARQVSKSVTALGKQHHCDDWTNAPPSILALLGRDLHKKPNHPLSIIRNLIENRLVPLGFTAYNDFAPVVSKYDNFDALGFPEDHPGRSKSDTYYLNKDTLLRTHTSAHEIECFQKTPTPGYLISADVYRRDTIDRTHYPAFHQMEGARTWSAANSEELAEKIRKDLESLPESKIAVDDPHPPFHEKNPKQSYQSDEVCELLGQHLKRTIELVMGDLFHYAKIAALEAGTTDPDLFQEPLRARWIETTFPWTSPSWEIEIWWKGEWLEMCGCGVVQKAVYEKSGMPDSVGWAFGIGLERAAMILFGVPDIRLFWSSDPRFVGQFKQEEIKNFQPWSKYPSSYRDVAFWTLPEIHENDVMEVVRGRGGDLVESVVLVDEFVHPKTGRKSQCYRVNYQSMERTLTNDEINDIQQNIIEDVKKLGVEIR